MVDNEEEERILASIKKEEETKDKRSIIADNIKNVWKFT